MNHTATRYESDEIGAMLSDEFSKLDGVINCVWRGQRKSSRAGGGASFRSILKCGPPAQTIVSSGIGNPIVLVDEVDKAGSAESTGGVSACLVTLLLGLLEL